ncbi:clotting factor B-like isoform X2 [Dermacentor andersoni]|uniref:clotting factor B-like isoform X2 n=1 Tax=Dermacentor andersoni TaxID=34620 RepID=UPI003B3AB5E5
MTSHKKFILQSCMLTDMSSCASSLSGRFLMLLNAAFICSYLIYSVSADTINGKGCGQFDKTKRASPGRKANRFSQPWIVYILAHFNPRQGQTEGSFECAGSIISPRFVLTSAHCLTNGKCTPTLVQVYYNSTVVQRGPYVAAKDVFYHPDNDSVYWANDIALLRLEEPLRFDPYVRPVCLGGKETVHNEVALPQWGRTQDEDSPKMLYYSTAKIEHFKECKKRLAIPDVKAANWNRMLLCTQSGGKNIAEGLSGGPLTLISEDRPATQVGVGSYTFCRKDFRPSAHTRVEPYIPWIKKVLNRCASWERRRSSSGRPHACNDGHTESSESDEPEMRLLM